MIPTATFDAFPAPTRHPVIEQQLAEIFVAVFEIPVGTDVSRIRQLNYPSWDSLAHVTLIGAMESEFDLTIDVDDSIGITSYAAALLYVQEHRG